MDVVWAVIVATSSGGLVYERYYQELSNAQKAQVRSACFELSQASLPQLSEEQGGVGLIRSQPVVFMPAADLVFFAVGAQPGAELLLKDTLHYLLAVLRSSLKKPLCEAVAVEKLGRLVTAVDDVINEGYLDNTDPDDVRRAAKYWQ